MTTPTDPDSSFLAWFTAAGGSYATSALGLSDFPDTGRGAVALRDIQEGEKLFTIPRTLVLSTRTSALPGLVGEETWKSSGVSDCWAGLILCMMWEEARGGESRWAGYMESMPTRFSTLMFWETEDLAYLRGSTVLEKIGKEEAERDYYDKVLPLLKRRPDLFPTSSLPVHYSLEKYHIQGSRILSRSFTVTPWSPAAATAEGEEGEGKDKDGDTLMGEVNVTGDDKDEAEGELEAGDVGEEDEEDEERERVEDVAMVPMADMLNARYGCNNARLFYAKDDLQMVATRRIKQGEQIWNTYGDPPNSDLLRRYGYVDAIKLQDGIGSPSDVVEIKADLVVQCVTDEGGPSAAEVGARIEWWLEEGGDDSFVVDTSHRLPDEMVSLVRLLQLSGEEWTKVREKGRPPKGRLDERSYSAVREAVRRRLSVYALSVQDQESLLAFSPEHLCETRRQALIVTSGEQRILERALERLERAHAANAESASRKRRAGAEGEQERDTAKGAKKARR